MLLSSTGKRHIVSMQTRTARYLDLVHEGRNDGWRYALGVLTIAFFWLGLGHLPYAWFADAVAGDPLLDLLALNFSILTMLAGLATAVRWLHGRTLKSVITPEARVDWARMARGAAAWVVVAALTAAAEHLLYPGRYYLSFDPQRFYYFAAAVIVLTPLQCAAEELVFRGYAIQGLALVTRRPALIAAASGVLFAAPHLLNPEVHQYGALVMAANYFAIGVVLAVIALRDGRLELAIGLHAANNVFLALVANYEGSALATGAVFTARELDPWYSLATLVAGGSGFYWWFFGRAGGQDEEPDARRPGAE
jgi:hypothetical protein